MHTIELTDDELRIVRTALHSYLDDFGHEEAELLRQIKATLAKLDAPVQLSGRRASDVDVADLTGEQLATLLREAEHAHGQFEKELGHPDEDWPGWYAQYILDKLASG